MFLVFAIIYLAIQRVLYFVFTYLILHRFVISILQKSHFRNCLTPRIAHKFMNFVNFYLYDYFISGVETTNFIHSLFSFSFFCCYFCRVSFVCIHLLLSFVVLGCFTKKNKKMKKNELKHVNWRVIFKQQINKSIQT